MAPASPHPMSTYEARKATFLPKEATAGPSRKKASAIAKSSWPHPFSSKSNDRSSDEGSQSSTKREDVYPSPRSLANLGLYYDPSPEFNDQCCIFPDGHKVSGWRPGQSALERLEEEDSTISWVMIEKSKRASAQKKVNEEGKLTWKREEESVYPSGKTMTDARFRTFGRAWPLDGKKGWKPTSKKLATNGFYFSPNDDEEDCVSCAYCQCSLGGWEKADDPVKEHQKRKPNCAIFISELEKVEKKQESGNGMASSSMAKGRSVSRKRAAAEATEVAEEDDISSSRAIKKNSSSIRKERKDRAEEPVMQEGAEEGKHDNVAESKEENKNEQEDKPAAKKRKKAVGSKAKAAVKKTNLTTEEPGEEVVVEEEEEPSYKLSKAKAKKGTKKTAATKTKEAAVQKVEKQKGEKKDIGMDLDVKEVEASDFEEEPSRSYNHESEEAVTKLAALERADSPPTSCESEAFKTPKQTTSGRTTGIEKTPKSTSPIAQTRADIAVAAPTAARTTTTTTTATTTTILQGDVPLLTKLDTITSRERTLTVEEYLKSHVGKACLEMESEGDKRIANLKIEMDRGRAKAERILRGIDINPSEG